MKKNIAVIFGGEGLERSVSEVGAESIISFIDKNLYTLLCIGISPSGDWYLYQGDGKEIKKGRWLLDNSLLTPTFPIMLNGKSGFLCDGEILPVDAALIILHGEKGEDGIIQGALDAAHIPYSGADVYGSAMTADKAYTKLCAERLGIPTAKWILASDKDETKARQEAERTIGYPMFIKPARCGSSFGAHPVKGREEFSSAFEDAIVKGGGRVIIEALVPVEYELECGYFEGGTPCFSPLGRILSGGKFYDYDAKYNGKDSPALELFGDGFGEIQRTVAEYSRLLVDFIGIRHLSRIDFFVTRDGRLLFNEINSIPGMTSASLYPRLTEAMGLQRGEFVNRLIDKVCSYDRHI